MTRYGWRLVTLLAAFWLLVAVTAAVPAGTETLVTVNTSQSNQVTPAVWDDYIVWVDHQTGWPDIIGYNFTDGNETVIATGITPSDQYDPAISRLFVVWTDFEEYQEELWALNRSTGVVFRVTDDPGYQREAAVWEDRLVYTDDRAGDDDIYLLNLTTGDEMLIAGGPGWQCRPAIYGDYVVWEDWSGWYADIWFCNLSEMSKVSLTPGTDDSDQLLPAICGDYVVWEDWSGWYADIWLCNLSDTSTVSLTPGTDDSDQLAPSIWGDYVVWEDWRDWNGDVWLCSVSTGTAELLTAGTGDSDQTGPVIQGDRVAWTDYRGDGADVRVYTFGTAEDPIYAAFDTNTTLGAVPLIVAFNDSSTGDPLHWHWIFGDGNESFAPDTVHTYASPGRYSVTLTVSTLLQRDAVFIEDCITAGFPPDARIGANRTEGLLPCTIAFEDRSTGEPDTWYWEFGDGTGDTVQDPVHTYTAAGCYNVTLTAENEFGNDTVVMEQYITVLAGVPSVAVTTFEGFNVTTIDDRQYAVLNTSIIPIYTLAGNSLCFSPPPSSGLSLVTINTTDAAGFVWTGPDTIGGNLTGAVIRSGLLDPTESCSLEYELLLARWPTDGCIELIGWGGAAPGDYTLFLLTAYKGDFTGIDGVCCTLQADHTGIGTAGALIRAGINQSWVSDHGGRDRIWLIRLSEDLYGEVLPTSFIGADDAAGIDWFEARSPHGLSRIAVTALEGSGNPLQMLYLSISSGTDDGGTGVATAGKAAENGGATPGDYVAMLICDATGTVMEGIFVNCSGCASLFIPQGAYACEADGSPLSHVSFKPLPEGEVPHLPDIFGTLLSGYVFSLGPDGASFDPPVEVVFSLPEGHPVPGMSYQVLVYDTATGEWEAVPTIIDPVGGAVTGEISHFSDVALAAVSPPGTTLQPPATTMVSATQTLPPATMGETHITISTGLLEWLTALLMKNPIMAIAGLAIVLAAAIWYRRR